MAKAKSKSGKETWEWIEAHGKYEGSLLTLRGMTVSDVESACGRGAVYRAQQYRLTLRPSHGFGASFPFVERVCGIVEAMTMKGWSMEKAEAYLRDYWLPRFHRDSCSASVPEGSQLPSDRVVMHYPCVA